MYAGNTKVAFKTDASHSMLVIEMRLFPELPNWYSVMVTKTSVGHPLSPFAVAAWRCRCWVPSVLDNAMCRRMEKRCLNFCRMSGRDEALWWAWRWCPPPPPPPMAASTSIPLPLLLPLVLPVCEAVKGAKRRPARPYGHRRRREDGIRRGKWEVGNTGMRFAPALGKGVLCILSLT